MHMLESYIAAYGSLALFVVVYLESMGAPLPGETLVMATSALAAAADIGLAAALMAIYAGAVLGDNTGYAIGRFGGRRLLLRYGSVIRITPERLTALEETFVRRGFLIVIGARFVVVLRQLNGLIAGSVRMPWLSFLLANMAGAALWVLVWGFGPFLLARYVWPLL